MKKQLITYYLLQSICVYSMQLTKEEKKFPQHVAMLLISKDNKEFPISDEAVNNSMILQRHKQFNNKKIPLEHKAQVVEFLATVLNAPLIQEKLIHRKIKELQNENIQNAPSLSEYTKALKEFDISLMQIVMEIPNAPQPMRMSLSNQTYAQVLQSSNSNAELWRDDSWRCGLIQCHHCRENPTHGLFLMLCSFKIFKCVKQDECCCCCFPFWCFSRRDGECEVDVCCM